MKIINPLKLNDWEIKKFLILVIAVQFAMWGTIFLDIIFGIEIPILRQLIGVFYLTFVPGFLILRILKIHRLDSAETLFYCVGLSLTFLIITGLLINLSLPLFGVYNPISQGPLILIISLIVIVMYFLSYLIDKEFDDPSFIDSEDLFSPINLLVLLIPFICIIGSFLVNYSENNILLMFMIVLIAFTFLLVIYAQDGSKKIYPLIIWIFSLSLLWHTTLIFSYVRVCDVIGEYYWAESVIKNSYWNYSTSGNYNSVLSTVLIAPIFYHICNIDLTWIFKVVYPFLYSFVSIGAYVLYSKYIKNSTIIFLSLFLLILISPFFLVVPYITKQAIAEIYLLEVIILLVSTNFNNVKKSLLLVLFSFSLVVSHYGTAFLFIISLIFTYLFIHIFTNKHILDFCKRYFSKNINTKWFKLDDSPINISCNFILFFIVLVIFWYMFVTNSSTFDSIVRMGENALNSIVDMFGYSRGAELITKDLNSPLYSITRYLYLVSQALIIVGFFNKLFCDKDSKFDYCYIGFSTYYLAMLFFSLVSSRFSVMDPRRLYHLSLFLLAPFSIFGGLYVTQIIKQVVSHKHLLSISYPFKPLSVFLAIFFLFSTGFVYEIAHDNPKSLSIGQKSIEKYGDIDSKALYYGSYVITQNVYSGKWLAKSMVSNKTIYRGDWVEGYPSLTIYGGIEDQKILTGLHRTDGDIIESFNNKTSNIGNGYVQLSYLNVVEGIGTSWYDVLQIITVYDFNDVSPLLTNKSKVYDNGGSQILWE